MTRPRSAAGLGAYRLFTRLASPAAPLILGQRAARGKEERTRMRERLGHTNLPRPSGRLIWVHGASVGESLSALPLVERLAAQPDTHVLVTSGTVTSAHILAQRLPQGAWHQYVPLDTPGAVRRFLDHWRPDAGLFVESDLWPNLILDAAARGVRMALINARISESSARRWGRARASAGALLDAFDWVLAQNEDFAERFRTLGARRVAVVGSLKADAQPLPVNADALTQMKAWIGDRPVLLAAQTHPGEDETILPVHDSLRVRFPDLLTIIVPRHVERGAAIAMLCDHRPSARRSRGDTLTPATAVYIADTLNELGLFYRLSSFCFLGGTLVPLGGHNPLEPAKLHCAVLAGPHTTSAPGAFNAVLDAQGFGRVLGSTDIARQATTLLVNPNAGIQAGNDAAQGAATLGGAVERTAAVLAELLDARA